MLSNDADVFAKHELLPLIIVIVYTQCICFGLAAAESKHCACLACAFFSWVALTYQKIVMALNFETSWIAGLLEGCDVQITTAFQDTSGALVLTPPAFCTCVGAFHSAEPMHPQMLIIALMMPKHLCVILHHESCDSRLWF